jgi:cyclopropane-fatty-acyl-phospholipid synthase
MAMKHADEFVLPSSGLASVDDFEICTLNADKACPVNVIDAAYHRLTPGSSVRRMSHSTWMDRWLVRLLLSRLPGLPLEIELWDGEIIRVSDVPDATRVTLRTRSTLLGLLLSPALAFGDGYSRNENRVSGDLCRFCEMLDLAQRRTPRWTDNQTWRWLSPNTRSASKDQIHQHYDLGNDFYRLWLDETMVYTCACFREPTLNLASAQRAKVDHVARKLRLRPGDRVVEAGCGWGGMAMHLAREYGVTVAAYNISREQVTYARERARAEGLGDRVEFIEDDWRSIEGQFDGFLSIGMLELVGPENLRRLGEVISRCLKPSRLALLHTIGRNMAKPLNGWIEKRIFPGGCPPSLRQMMEIFELQDFSILDVENLRLHYARTLELWRENFESHAMEVERMFDANFVRMWRLYLNGSIASFRTGGLQLFQIVFAHGQNNALPWTRADLYKEPERV